MATETPAGRKGPPELGLGKINATAFKIKRPDNSAVDEIEGMITPFTLVHLVLVAENEEMAWEMLEDACITRGQLIDLIDLKRERIARHFLPVLEPSKVAYRVEMNCPEAASRPTVHCHVIMGNKELFGKNGLVRRCVDSILKPELIAQKAVHEDGLRRRALLLERSPED